MYIGDLHIHSRYSRATSREGTPEHLELWARKKGIDLVGTGDFTHPAWREELREKLEPAEEGLYVLKEEFRIRDEETPDDRRPRFVVTGEISSIYKKKDKVRKVHSLLLMPGLEEAEKLSRRLELIGNIHSDGRPILGLDCRDLLEIMLETNPEAVYVPAHIWTPHFSLFGAFSGFDRIEDCFEDLTPYIHALETGLSSDPPMNWRISALDSYQLISNSDAHSPAKLGREATLFDTELSYAGMAEAIQTGKGLSSTLEFFPEEGKYHFDGHRKCGLCISPEEAKEYGGICPVCGKKITIGVLHRVEELADRAEGYVLHNAKPFESLVPLPEVIAASTGISSAGKKAQEQYGKLLRGLGSEFSILREIPIEDIKKAAGPLVAEGILRLRQGKVERTPGFDGEYGTVRLLSPGEISELSGQLSLFSTEELRRQEKAGKEEKKAAKKGTGKEQAQEAAVPEKKALLLNQSQQEAVEATERAVAVIAGPGTGKTKTLLSRLEYMLTERKISPSEITAVTFTNKAAEEMKSRLEKLPGGKRAGKRIRIGTFHAICSRILTDSGLSFFIADPGLQEELAEKTVKECGLKLSGNRFLKAVSSYKSGMEKEGTTWEPEELEAFGFYREQLRSAGALDYDDLLLETLELFEAGEIPPESEKNFHYLLVDEFQDINPIQYRLIEAWNKNGKELFVIGDPDQSIYGFRGSDAQCFSRLKEAFPLQRVIRLKDHYRCTPEILNGALSVIAHNSGQERQMSAVRGEGPKIRIVSAADERSEAIFIAKEINRLVGGIDMVEVDEKSGRQDIGIRGFSDIAVLYRTHRQSRLLEYCLGQEGIPYVVAGREDFLLEKEVRGVLYFFRYILRPRDDQAKKLAIKLAWSAGEENAEEAFELLAKKYEKPVHKAKPVRLLEEWISDRKLEENEALKKLTDMAVLHSSVEEFLQTLSFGEDGDIKRCGQRRFLADAVTLMTFHGAKGLEFPAVFLYGMKKGLVPLETAGKTSDVEEERRLFYVGMTRAKEELILTASGEESPFLREITPDTTVRESTRKEKTIQEAVQLSLFDMMV